MMVDNITYRDAIWATETYLSFRFNLPVWTEYIPNGNLDKYVDQIIYNIILKNIESLQREFVINTDCLNEDLRIGDI